MARRHQRTHLADPPEVLRLDIRPTAAHPLLKLWAFRRPFVAGQLIKEALEVVLRREGEEGLDRLLAALAKGAEEAPVVAPPTPYKRQQPAPDIQPAAPDLSVAAAEAVPAAPVFEPPAVEPPARVEAIAEVKVVAPEPEPERAPAPAVVEPTPGPIASVVPDSAMAVETVAEPPVGAHQARAIEAPPAASPPQPAARPADPVEALAMLGTDALRERQHRNMAALLQNDALFK